MKTKSIVFRTLQIVACLAMARALTVTATAEPIICASAAETDALKKLRSGGFIEFLDSNARTLPAACITDLMSCASTNFQPGGLHIVGAEITNSISFPNCDCAHEIRFERCRFRGPVDFHSARFRSTVSFAGSVFEDTFNLSDATINGDLNLSQA